MGGSGAHVNPVLEALMAAVDGPSKTSSAERSCEAGRFGVERWVGSG
jgi:hypothetical protein